MQARLVLPVVLIGLSGLAFSACLPGSDPEDAQNVPAVMMDDDSAMEAETSMDGTTAEPTEGEEAMTTSVMAEDGLVAVSADNFSYDVTEIKAKVGEPLTISVTNSEGFHDFVIDELEVNSGMIPAGETMDIVIPTDKPGTYEYYCSVGEHRKMGMFGTLIIE